MTKHCAQCGNLIPRPANMHGTNYHRAKYCSKRCGWDAKLRPLYEALLFTTRNAETGCLDWLRGTNDDGYPTMSFLGKMQLVSRVVLQEKLGRKLKAGECACHTCDRPICVEAGHLWPGTHQQNMADSVTKSRHRHTEMHGIEHPFAKLDDDSARAIFLNAEGLIARDQAALFGVSTGTIYDIRHRRKWKHATVGLEAAR